MNNVNNVNNVYNYNKIKTSPALIVIIGYVYLSILFIYLLLFGFIENNNFFKWGVPIIIMNKKIDDIRIFYSIWVGIFIDSAIYTGFNEVVYSWLINYIQDPKSIDTIYSKYTSLLLITLNSLYHTIHALIFINSITIQISFIIANFIGKIIIEIYINRQYILRVYKNKDELLLNLLN